MLRRFLPILVLLLAVVQDANCQVRGVLGLPDRIMSSSRIGRASVRKYASMPLEDTVRISFPSGGSKSISNDYDFFNYLEDNGFSIDARTLVSGSYAPSDTLDFLRAKVLFSERKFSQSYDLFSSVPLDSPFGPESFYYGTVALSGAGEYSKAYERLVSNGGPYGELADVQAAALSLLLDDREGWMSHSAGFGYSDYTLSESERILSEIANSRFFSTSKHAGIAALASAVVPGAGKVYAGRLGEGIASFLTVGSLGAITAENWKKRGLSDWRTIVAGSLCASFYLGNIYGSYMSVSIERDELRSAENTVILYHIHLPLRSIFR